MHQIPPYFFWDIPNLTQHKQTDRNLSHLHYAKKWPQRKKWASVRQENGASMDTEGYGPTNLTDFHPKGWKQGRYKQIDLG
jgi:hypothetical protein